MRVVLLHGSNDNYGASRVLLDEVRVLVGLGYDVTVAVPTDGPLRNQCAHVGAQLIVDPTLIVLRKANLRDAIGIPKLPNYAQHADLIVIWTLAMAAYIPALRIAKTRFYVSVHELQENIIGKALCALLARGSYPVVCCSKAVARWVRKEGVEAQRLYVTYPILDFEHPDREPRSKPPSPITVAVVGRLNGHKGHLDVLAALKSPVLANVPIDLRLFGGPFPGQEYAAEEIRTAAIAEDRARLMGEVPDMAEHLRDVDIVACFPTKPEPFGLVPIEAWAAGARSVGFNDGGAGEVLPSVGGIGFERGSSIANCIALVIDNWDRLPDLPNHREVSSQYSLAARRDVLNRVLDAV
ncbi:Glycosyltransferase involved in cell wall bisynthesis [Rhodococcus rhodochrous J3]|uniref:Glycosyltransferase involved in cell wall bisynthesis n=1 Tax=Rhodococcus rhodochrous J3 TaxID=903528 RepID=A0ABY1MAT4_RHORH|nr:glycosyltransferase family 4 protein [Rhodococcus rhodochrous]SMG36750.1 Glycosyltransferase involved in cell wall bisynthesis [Rhodococcus rhodochrous J3]